MFKVILDVKRIFILIVFFPEFPLNSFDSDCEKRFAFSLFPIRAVDLGGLVLHGRSVMFSLNSKLNIKKENLSQCIVE